MATTLGAKPMSAKSARKKTVLTAKALGRTRAGDSRATSWPAHRAARSDAMAPAIIIPGNCLTAKLERKRASRVARLITNAAMLTVDVTVAAATKGRWEGALAFTVKRGRFGSYP